MWLLVLILLIAVFIDMALSSNRVGNDLPRDKLCFRAERFKILKCHAPGGSVRNAKFSAGAKFFRAASVSTGTGNILSAQGDACCQTFGWRCLIFARQRKLRTGALRPPRRSRSRPRFVLLVSRTSTRTIGFRIKIRSLSVRFSLPGLFQWQCPVRGGRGWSCSTGPGEGSVRTRH